MSADGYYSSKFTSDYRDYLVSQGRDDLAQLDDRSLTSMLIDQATEEQGGKLDLSVFPDDFRVAARHVLLEAPEDYKNRNVADVFAKEFSRGVSSGIDTMQGGYKAAGGLLAGAVGFEDAEAGLMKSAGEEFQQAQREGSSMRGKMNLAWEQLVEEGDFGPFGRWLSSGAGEALASGIDMLVGVTTGVGAAAAGGRMAAKKIAMKEVKDIAERKAKVNAQAAKYGAAGATAGSMLTSGSQNTGHVYEELYGYTQLPENNPLYMSPAEARTKSLAAGAVMGSLDSVVPVLLTKTLGKKMAADSARGVVSKMIKGMPEGTIFTKELAKDLGKTALGVAGTGATEAGTEALQEIIQMLVVKDHTGEDWTKGDYNRLIEAGALGFLGGAQMKVAGDVIGVGVDVNRELGDQRRKQKTIEAVKRLSETPEGKEFLKQVESSLREINDLSTNLQVDDTVVSLADDKSYKVTHVDGGRLNLESLDGGENIEGVPAIKYRKSIAKPEEQTEETEQTEEEEEAPETESGVVDQKLFVDGNQVFLGSDKTIEIGSFEKEETDDGITLTKVNPNVAENFEEKQIREVVEPALQEEASKKKKAFRVGDGDWVLPYSFDPAQSYPSDTTVEQMQEFLDLTHDPAENSPYNSDKAKAIRQKIIDYGDTEGMLVEGIPVFDPNLSAQQELAVAATYNAAVNTLNPNLENKVVTDQVNAQINELKNQKARSATKTLLGRRDDFETTTNNRLQYTGGLAPESPLTSRGGQTPEQKAAEKRQKAIALRRRTFEGAKERGNELWNIGKKPSRYIEINDQGTVTVERLDKDNQVVREEIDVEDLGTISPHKAKAVLIKDGKLVPKPPPPPPEPKEPKSKVKTFFGIFSRPDPAPEGKVEYTKLDIIAHLGSKDVPQQFVLDPVLAVIDGQDVAIGYRTKDGTEVLIDNLPEIQIANVGIIKGIPLRSRSFEYGGERGYFANHFNRLVRIHATKAGHETYVVNDQRSGGGNRKPASPKSKSLTYPDDFKSKEFSDKRTGVSFIDELDYESFSDELWTFLENLDDKEVEKALGDKELRKSKGLSSVAVVLQDSGGIAVRNIFYETRKERDNKAIEVGYGKYILQIYQGKIKNTSKFAPFALSQAGNPANASFVVRSDGEGSFATNASGEIRIDGSGFKVLGLLKFDGSVTVSENFASMEDFLAAVDKQNEKALQNGTPSYRFGKGDRSEEVARGDDYDPYLHLYVPENSRESVRKALVRLAEIRLEVIAQDEYKNRELFKDYAKILEEVKSSGGNIRVSDFENFEAQFVLITSSRKGKKARETIYNKLGLGDLTTASKSANKDRKLKLREMKDYKDSAQLRDLLALQKFPKILERLKQLYPNLFREIIDLEISQKGSIHRFMLANGIDTENIQANRDKLLRQLRAAVSLEKLMKIRDAQSSINDDLESALDYAIRKIEDKSSDLTDEELSKIIETDIAYLEDDISKVLEDANDQLQERQSELNEAKADLSSFNTFDEKAFQETEEYKSLQASKDQLTEEDYQTVLKRYKDLFAQEQAGESTEITVDNIDDQYQKEALEDTIERLESEIAAINKAIEDANNVVPRLVKMVEDPELRKKYLASTDDEKTKQQVQSLISELEVPGANELSVEGAKRELAKVKENLAIQTGAPFENFVTLFENNPDLSDLELQKSLDNLLSNLVGAESIGMALSEAISNKDLKEKFIKAWLDDVSDSQGSKTYDLLNDATVTEGEESALNEMQDDLGAMEAGSYGIESGPAAGSETQLAGISPEQVRESEEVIKEFLSAFSPDLPLSGKLALRRALELATDQTIIDSLEMLMSNSQLDTLDINFASHPEWERHLNELRKSNTIGGKSVRHGEYSVFDQKVTMGSVYGSMESASKEERMAHLLRVLAEELQHAVTINTINALVMWSIEGRVPKSYKGNMSIADFEAMAEMNTTVFNFLKEHFASKGVFKYELSNPAEMWAAYATDAKFRTAIDKIKMPQAVRAKLRTRLQRLGDFFRRVLARIFSGISEASPLEMMDIQLKKFYKDSNRVSIENDWAFGGRAKLGSQLFLDFAGDTIETESAGPTYQQMHNIPEGATIEEVSKILIDYYEFEDLSDIEGTALIASKYLGFKPSDMESAMRRAYANRFRLGSESMSEGVGKFNKYKEFKKSLLDTESAMQSLGGVDKEGRAILEDGEYFEGKVQQEKLDNLVKNLNKYKDSKAVVFPKKLSEELDDVLGMFITPQVPSDRGSVRNNKYRVEYAKGKKGEPDDKKAKGIRLRILNDDKDGVDSKELHRTRTTGEMVNYILDNYINTKEQTEQTEQLTGFHTFMKLAESGQLEEDFVKDVEIKIGDDLLYFYDPEGPEAAAMSGFTEQIAEAKVLDIYYVDGYEVGDSAQDEISIYELTYSPEVYKFKIQIAGQPKPAVVDPKNLGPIKWNTPIESKKKSSPEENPGFPFSELLKLGDEYKLDELKVSKGDTVLYFWDSPESTAKNRSFRSVEATVLEVIHEDHDNLDGVIVNKDTISDNRVKIKVQTGMMPSPTNTGLANLGPLFVTETDVTETGKKSKKKSSLRTAMEARDARKEIDKRAEDYQQVGYNEPITPLQQDRIVVLKAFADYLNTLILSGRTPSGIFQEAIEMSKRFGFTYERDVAYEPTEDLSQKTKQTGGPLAIKSPFDGETIFRGIPEQELVSQEGQQNFISALVRNIENALENPQSVLYPQMRDVNDVSEVPGKMHVYTKMSLGSETSEFEAVPLTRNEVEQNMEMEYVSLLEVQKVVENALNEFLSTEEASKLDNDMVKKVMRGLSKVNDKATNSVIRSVRKALNSSKRKGQRATDPAAQAQEIERMAESKDIELKESISSFATLALKLKTARDAVRKLQSQRRHLVKRMQAVEKDTSDQQKIVSEVDDQLTTLAKGKKYDPDAVKKQILEDLGQAIKTQRYLRYLEPQYPEHSIKKLKDSLQVDRVYEVLSDLINQDVVPEDMTKQEIFDALEITAQDVFNDSIETNEINNAVARSLIAELLSTESKAKTKAMFTIDMRLAFGKLIASVDQAMQELRRAALTSDWKSIKAEGILKKQLGAVIGLQKKKSIALEKITELGVTKAIASPLIEAVDQRTMELGAYLGETLFPQVAVGDKVTMLDVDEEGNVFTKQVEWQASGDKFNEYVKAIRRTMEILKNPKHSAKYDQAYIEYWKQAYALIEEPLMNTRDASYAGSLFAMLESFSQTVSRAGTEEALMITSMFNKLNTDLRLETGRFVQQGHRTAKAFRNLQKVLRNSERSIYNLNKGQRYSLEDIRNFLYDPFMTFVEGQIDAKRSDLVDLASDFWKQKTKEATPGTIVMNRESREAWLKLITEVERSNDMVVKLAERLGLPIEDEVQIVDPILHNRTLFRDRIPMSDALTVPRRINYTKLSEAAKSLQQDGSDIITVVTSAVRQKIEEDEDYSPNAFKAQLAAFDGLNADVTANFLDAVFEDDNNPRNLGWDMNGQPVSMQEIRMAWESSVGANGGARLADMIHNLAINKDLPKYFKNISSFLEQLQRRSQAIISENNNYNRQINQREKNPKLLVYKQEAYGSLTGRKQGNVLPGVFYEYNMMTEIDMRQTAARLLLAHHFGRKEEKFLAAFDQLSQTLEAAENEFSKIYRKVSTQEFPFRAIDNASKSHPELSSKFNLQAFNKYGVPPSIKKKLSTEEYARLRKLYTLILSLRQAKKVLPSYKAYANDQSSFLGDERLPLEILQTASTVLVAKPNSAVMNLASLFQLFQYYDLNPTSVKSSLKVLKGLSKEVLDTVVQSFGSTMGRNLKYGEKALAPLWTQQDSATEARFDFAGASGNLGDVDYSTKTGISAGMRKFLRAVQRGTTSGLKIPKVNNKVINMILNGVPGREKLAEEGELTTPPGSLSTFSLIPGVTNVFSWLNNAVLKQSSLAILADLRTRVELAAHVLDAKSIPVDDLNYQLTKDDLGYTQGMLGLAHKDTMEVYERIDRELADFGLSVTRLAQDFRKRRKEDITADPITDENKKVAAYIASTRITFDGASAKAQILQTKLGVFASPLLGWTSSMAAHANRLARQPDGAVDFNSAETYKALGTYATLFAAVGIPISLAVFKLAELYDEEYLGRESGVGDVPAYAYLPFGSLLGISDPAFRTLSFVERLGRTSSAGGFYQETLTNLLLQGTGEIPRRDLLQRVLGFGILYGAGNAMVNYYNSLDLSTPETFIPDYASVVRPLMYVSGLGNVVQFSQFANNFMPAPIFSSEYEITNLLNKRRKLRAYTKALGIETAKSGSVSYSMTPMTRAIRAMERAAYAGNRESFLDAYRMALQLSTAEDPAKDIIDRFKRRNLKSGISKYALSDSDWNTLMSVLDEDDRREIQDGLSKHSYYIQLIGGNPPGPARTERRQIDDLKRRALL